MIFYLHFDLVAEKLNKKSRGDNMKQELHAQFAPKLQAGRPGFKYRLEEFMASVTIQQPYRDDFIKEIARLMMKVQEGAGSSVVRRKAFRLNIEDDFKYFKEQYLDVSKYLLSTVWTATLDKIQKGVDSPNEMVRSDVDYLISLLDDNDVDTIKNKPPRNESLNVDSIDLSTWTTGKEKKKNMDEYAKSKIYTLSFISDYDKCFDKEDWAQDMKCEIIRVINSYPRSNCTNFISADSLPDRVNQYVETASNNKVNNIKERYTCETRRRVVSTVDPLYKEIKKLKKLSKIDNSPEIFDKITKIYKEINQSGAEYKSLVTSLVCATDDGDLRVMEVADPNYQDGCNSNKLPNELKSYGEDEAQSTTESAAEDMIENSSSDTMMYIGKLCDRVDDKVASFIKIVVGIPNEDFEIWALDNGVNTDKHDALIKGARTYCKVTRKELEQNPVLEEILEDLRS